MRDSSNSRREFLKGLAAFSVAGTTAYFLPPIGGWHSDVITHAPFTAEGIEFDGLNRELKYIFGSPLRGIDFLSIDGGTKLWDCSYSDAKPIGTIMQFCAREKWHDGDLHQPRSIQL